MNTYFVDAVIDDVFDDLVNIKGYSESEAYKAIYQGGLTIKSTQNLQIQKICDEEVADKANYDAGTKYSFYLSFQVKEKDGTIKTYTNQTMLSYYKKEKQKSELFDQFYIGGGLPGCNCTVRKRCPRKRGQAGRKFRVYFHYHAAAGGDDDHGSVDR